MGKLQVRKQMLRLGSHRAGQDAGASFRPLGGRHYTRHGLKFLVAFQFAAGPCRAECEPYINSRTNV